MEVGANGPFWGFGASILVALAGFSMGIAGLRMPTDLGVNVHLPLAYWFMRGIFTDRWSHTITFFSNPVLLAAWIGFFVQGLNLLPIGQLDGGHVLYAFAGNRHRIISIALGVLFLFFAVFHPQWLLWVALIFFVLGLRHPPCMDDRPPLSAWQRTLGILSVVIFIVSFLPVPFA
jgi:membrane-associated protease RseP (regulator of RpoE activity)